MVDDATRVLICDDDKALRDVLCLLLQDLNCEIVASCQNAKYAIEQFISTRPDLVFMDIQMPEKNGIAALREILKIDRHAKVIMLSGLDDVVLAESSTHTGSIGYVRKGDAADKLYGALNDMLDHLGFETNMTSSGVWD